VVRKLGEKADNVSGDRTIYDVGWGELMGRNFVAGMSRAVGGLFINIVLVVVVGSLVVQYVWPQLQPVVDQLNNSYQTLFRLEQTLSGQSETGGLPLVGESLQFDIRQLGQPGEETKSVELDASQLEKLLFGDTDKDGVN
jgi:hypothetical protein